MPKPKGVQNKLKMLELALKSKILYVVWMWAKTGRGNPPNKPFEYMYLDTQIDLKPSAVLLSLHWISDIVTPDLNHGRT